LQWWWWNGWKFAFDYSVPLNENMRLESDEVHLSCQDSWIRCCRKSIIWITGKYLEKEVEVVNLRLAEG
jgi:hypothetical protein